MRIVSIRIENFRCIRTAEIFPAQHNVLLGPNNTGKTAILEALNLLLNPEITFRSNAIDENDFFRRLYLESAPAGVSPVDMAAAGRATSQASPSTNVPEGDGSTGETTTGILPPPGIVEAAPRIRIEAVLSDLSEDDEDMFRDYLVPWKQEGRSVVEAVPEGEDAFASAVPAVRVFFEAWYDEGEDAFAYDTFFLRSAGLAREECPRFAREHKRHIGFLIYRDFRALTRALTLEPVTLFARLLQSQEVPLRGFDDVLGRIEGALAPMTGSAEVAAIINSYKSELERFLSLSSGGASALSFELTNRTRTELKAAAQMYVRDEVALPLQRMGAGTRSLALLAMLTLIMRRRGRGILALEEPETFLFPHAQRRVIDECLDLADQVFVTTHSPYVLERLPAESVVRIERAAEGEVKWRSIATTDVKQLNLYSKRLRQVFCEAILGRGVVIVEGDSDRWWINGASRILNRKEWNKRRQEALELQGIAVVSADTNGDILKLGRFFVEAGLKTTAIVDRVIDSGLVGELCQAPFPVVFLKQKGLESLLADYLGIDLLRRVLTETPASRIPLRTKEAVETLSDEEVRAKAKDFFEGNKGSAAAHEWVIALLEDATLPDALKEIIDLVSRYVSCDADLGTSFMIV
jgi:putative ATP-dependent endonuclease of the OLD family